MQILLQEICPDLEKCESWFHTYDIGMLLAHLDAKPNHEESAAIFIIPLQKGSRSLQAKAIAET